MKRTILAAVVGTTLIAMSGTVEAIIHGYPDNLFHPNVGFIAIESINGPEQKLNLKCSGTLIAPRVFLTAAECTAGLDIVIDPNDGTIRNLYVGFTIRWNPTKQINNITNCLCTRWIRS